MKASAQEIARNRAAKQRRIDRIEHMMKEASMLSAELCRTDPKHPAAYAMNRAWRALEEARNILLPAPSAPVAGKE